MTPTKVAWHNMKARCQNPNHPAYANYGGRNITVCARWLESYTNFKEDMGHVPDGFTLERKDNDGNYEPGNCRWATPAEQAANRRPISTKSNNTSGKIGVTYHKGNKQWLAYATKQGVKTVLYRGTNLEAAIAARTSWEDSCCLS